MSFGFGKDSGPKEKDPYKVHLASPALPRMEEPTVRWGDGKISSFQDGGARTHQLPAAVAPSIGLSKPSNGTPANAGFHPPKRANPPYFTSPDEIVKRSRSSTDGSFPSVTTTDRSNMTPNQARSPPKVFQKNLYVGGPNPHTVVAQQLQYPPSIWGNRTPSSTRDVNIPVQGVISPSPIVQPRPVFNTKNTDVLSNQTNFPSTAMHNTVFRPYSNTSPSRHLINYRDLDNPNSEEMPSLASRNNSYPGKYPRPSGGNEKSFPSYPMHVQESAPFVSSKNWNHHSEKNTKNEENEDASVFKGTRSPTLRSAGMSFMNNSAVTLGEQRVYDRRSPGRPSVSPSPSSGKTENLGAKMDKRFAVVSKAGSPLIPSSDHASQEHSENLEEAERERDAKAKRLARFRDELIQPEQSQFSMGNQKSAARAQPQFMPTKQKLTVDPSINAIGDSATGGVSSDYEGVVSTNVIIGSCPDMCPESERAERERKGDLDQYERQDGDRNLTNELMAVKKYNRTAEREAELIRPMPVLQNTMNYLLSLLRKPYDHSFLGLYNFLWDRMRAIRMDLRMQHIFNLEAINMLEQMIRLHIIAMYELCEHMKGEGFSEGFDAHLNIEQMNKTSVELFQLYDDHRKKGIYVPSEKEFRGYYALLKLDKHPGYKVEPAELSLDLAKMTPEMRQTPEVLFARDVARACRASNFIAFFRLASRATYLQACLMHAHFSKLRIQALASLHTGLQINQGIPISHVSKWLGMEAEDIGEIMGLSGFSVKDFEEPYLVKENAIVDLDYEVPLRRSKLVERKRSSEVVSDVLYSSPTETRPPKEVKEIKPRKAPVKVSEVSTSAKTVTIPVQDEEMLDFPTIVSPKISPRKLPQWTSTDFMIQDAKIDGDVPRFVSSSALDIVTVDPRARDQYRQPEYSPMFRSSFGRSTLPEVEVKAPIPLGVEYENKHSALLVGSVEPTPAPSFSENLDVLEDSEQNINIGKEDTSDAEARRSYDEEVKAAKLKLALRTWKRHAERKRELRVHKLSAANSALELLSLGPPIWTFEEQPTNISALNIDQSMKKRHEIQEKSMSVLNPADLIASELHEKNPGYKCLCWKLLLCTPDVSYGFGTELQNMVPDSCSWLKSKLLSDNRDDERDLLVSSPGIAIWRSWISVENDPDETCCISVVRHCTLESLDNANAGTSAVLFLSAEDIPTEVQRKQLHGIMMSLPPDSSLPLLILSDSKAYDLDSSILAHDLGVYEIKQSRIAQVHTAFLRDTGTENSDGFFSDEYLREELKWLASESPPQVVLAETTTRDLVLSHLNSTTFKAIAEVDYQKVSPNQCISAFNRALDLSMEDVFAAAQANPTGWPCPEIELLHESSEEYKFASWFLPSLGWSSFSQTGLLRHAFSSTKLPDLEDDLSWLADGIDTIDDFESQKQRLEGCLIHYLTETSKMIDAGFARTESEMLVQKFTRLELLNDNYYIVPEWPSIFRRLYNWRLIKLSSRGVLSTYVLAGSCYSSPENSEQIALSLTSQVAHPSLDEQIQVVACGFSPDHLDEYKADRPSSSPVLDPSTLQENFQLEDEERHRALTSTDISVAQETNTERRMRHIKEDDRLNQVLQKCNIVQSRIDKILSIYF